MVINNNNNMMMMIVGGGIMIWEYAALSCLIYAALDELPLLREHQTIYLIDAEYEGLLLHFIHESTKSEDSKL